MLKWHKFILSQDCFPICPLQLSLEPFGDAKPVMYYVLCPEHVVPLAHMFMRVSGNMN